MCKKECDKKCGKCTNAGTTISISNSVPVTFDARGYEALKFTEIGEFVEPPLLIPDVETSTLLEALEIIASNCGGVLSELLKGTGICMHLKMYNVSRADCSDFYTHTRTWEFFSGNDNYPVPHPIHKSKQSAKNAYYNMPLWSGKYGELRMDLVKHVISEIKGGK